MTVDPSYISDLSNRNTEREINKTISQKREKYTPSRELDYNPQNSSYSSGQDREIEILELVKIALRRKFLVLSFLTLGAVAGVFFALQKTPLYKATATAEVRKQETQIVDGSGVEPSIIADLEFMQTQFALLKSRSLAERVVLSLGLERNPNLANQASSQNDRIKEASGTVIQNLSVGPVGRSRVIQVSYVSADAAMASAIPNAVIDNFIETTLERKFDTTKYARNFLEERLAQAKINLEEAERGLVEYADANDILELSQSGDQSNLVSTNLMSLSEEYLEAQSERIKLEQDYRALQNRAATVGALQSENLARLRARKSDLNSEYQKLLGKFKPGYPDMIELAARIKTVDSEIAQEREILSIFSDEAYRSALARENIIGEKVESLKRDLRSLRTRRIDYTILRREVDTARTQYDALLQRLKEVSTASGVGSSQISIVDRAVRPKLPFTPNIPLLLAIGALLGLATGLGLAFILQSLDNTIKTPEDVKEKLKLPAIGVIPLLKTKDGGRDLIISELENPRSAISEAYFSARTSLEYTSNNGMPKSILVTSTQPAEGKSSTALALAVSIAKVGRTVLIVDADLRKPSFEVKDDKSCGLSGLLTSTRPLQEHIASSRVHDVHLLPSGVIPPNPAELLSSRGMKALIEEAEGMFDVVIVDSPPVLNFTDAPVIGGVCEATLIVYKSGNIHTPAAQRTVERLKENGANVIGAILTHFDAKKTGYNYDYYYAYGKGATEYGKEENPKNASSSRKIRLFSDKTAK